MRNISLNINVLNEQWYGQDYYISNALIQLIFSKNCLLYFLLIFKIETFIIIALLIFVTEFDR